jgi:hypothetical protein
VITTIAIEETTANIAYKNLITFGATKVSNLKSNNDFNSSIIPPYLRVMLRVPKYPLAELTNPKVLVVPAGRTHSCLDHFAEARK